VRHSVDRIPKNMRRSKARPPPPLRAPPPNTTGVRRIWGRQGGQRQPPSSPSKLEGGTEGNRAQVGRMKERMPHLPLLVPMLLTPCRRRHVY